MSRYRGPKLRITRRLGSLPGLTSKISRNNTVRPGQHGNINKNKTTEYGLRLEEKQKLKFNYGITENQLYRLVKEARRRKGITGLILLQLLEMRLDTICYNFGFASSITQARQLVNHGHITVNQKVINIPSFQCQLNDVIGIKQKKKSKNLLSSNFKTNKKPELFPNLKFDESKLEGTVLDYCDRNNINLNIKELLVIEYYSRR